MSDERNPIVGQPDLIWNQMMERMKNEPSNLLRAQGATHMTEPKITREELEREIAQFKNFIARDEKLEASDHPGKPQILPAIKNNIARNKREIALRTLALQALAMQPRPTACVSVMQTSAGPEYYVQFDCGGRTTTPYRFKERYKAEYHVAHFNWIFHGGDEPQLMDYNPESWPGKPLSSLPEPRT